MTDWKHSTWTLGKRAPRPRISGRSPLRFGDEIELAFGGAQFDFLTAAFSRTLDLDDTDTEPKVVVSEYRSTAIVAQQKCDQLPLSARSENHGRREKGETDCTAYLQMMEK